MAIHRRFGWSASEEYALGLIVTILSDGEHIEGLPQPFFYKDLITVVSEKAPDDRRSPPTYEIVTHDLPSPQIQRALRSLLGNRLYDAVFKEGALQYTENDEGFRTLQTPTEADYQHILRELRSDFERSSKKK